MEMWRIDKRISNVNLVTASFENRQMHFKCELGHSVFSFLIVFAALAVHFTQRVIKA